MKIYNILLLFFCLFLPLISFAFEIPYQYVSDYDLEDILVNVYQGDNKYKFYKCNIDNLDCSEYNSKNFKKDPTRENIFYSPDFKKIIQQVKIKNNRYITLFIENNNNHSFKAVIPFSKKIKKVIFGKREDNFLFFSLGEIFFIEKKESNYNVKKIKNSIKLSFLNVSPSLKYLAYYIPATKNNGYLRSFILYDLKNNKEKIFHKENIAYWDLLTENNKLIEFVDDNNLIFLSDHENFQNLYLYQIDSEKIERLFPENFVVKDFLVVEKVLYFTANKENPLKWDLFSYNFENKTLTKVSDNIAYDFNLFKIKNFLFFKKVKEYPPVISSLEINNGSIREINISTTSLSIKNGLVDNVEGIYFSVILPENFDKNKNYDLLVWLHGGPHRQSSLGFHPYLSYGIYDYLLEKIREENFIITKIDYVGSFGYGRKFAEDLRFNIGKKDVDSVLKVIEKIKGEYPINKINLMGISYGGYLSLKTMYEYPEKIERAISINGVTDWWTLINNNPSSIFKIFFESNDYDTSKKYYDQASVFLEPERLRKKKILIIYGEKDSTVPVSQQKLFLKKFNNIANLSVLSFPEEKHVFYSSKNWENFLQKIKSFLTD